MSSNSRMGLPLNRASFLALIDYVQDCLSACSARKV